MSGKHQIGPCLLVILLFAGTASRIKASEKVDLVDQTLSLLGDCMSAHPVLWPESWQREYLERIRRVLVSCEDKPGFALRLEILGNGFQSYWERLEKARSRPSFEVKCAQIRWYVEHLMETAIPNEIERQSLRDQWKDLYDHAASSLLDQFSFLDPNRIRSISAMRLSECHRGIDAPLEPVFLGLFTEAEMKQIKQRWHDSRYSRVEIFSQLGGDDIMLDEGPKGSFSDEHPHSLLAERCLAQYLAHIRMIVGSD